MSTSGDAALGRIFHAALITRDWELLRSVLHDDVLWTLPGENQISGTATGADEVIARGQLIASYGVSFTLLHILVSRTNVALNIHNEARRGDLRLDEHLATVLRVDGSRVRDIETYLSDVDGMDAFFRDLP
jgi:ketosteroid isomerase-like protein